MLTVTGSKVAAKQQLLESGARGGGAIGKPHPCACMQAAHPDFLWSLFAPRSCPLITPG